MGGSKQYFRLILTNAGDQDAVRRIHEEKLNNYAKYKQPWTNEDLGKQPRGPMGEVLDFITKRPLSEVLPDFEIKHTNTTTTTKDYIFIMSTSLCCEDKEIEGEY